ncbi:hypothetical protein HC256_004632 [Beauveria bassiana]|nr:hypothetical protein HC256_004632 [Beauveria bassiana]
MDGAINVTNALETAAKASRAYVSSEFDENTASQSRCCFRIRSVASKYATWKQYRKGKQASTFGRGLRSTAGSSITTQYKAAVAMASPAPCHSYQSARALLRCMRLIVSVGVREHGFEQCISYMKRGCEIPLQSDESDH